jgi:hypothetical protein
VVLAEIADFDNELTATHRHSVRFARVTTTTSSTSQ